MDDEQELDDFDAAYRLGSTVLEMADRLKVANACAPGAQASYSFEMDGSTFKLVMSVTPPDHDA